ncbi:MAG TPA: hypothetical protein VFJ16_08985 [Longimicrobium sp.]|nr:hypothetical protein [Longimicrobium sp.]
MRAKRPFIYLAVYGALLGGAAACNGGSPTEATAMQIPNTPAPRDTSPMIPPSPLGTGH